MIEPEICTQNGHNRSSEIRQVSNISLIPLHLGAVIPTNCRKIDAESVAKCVYNTDSSTPSPIVTQYNKIATPLVLYNNVNSLLALC